MKTKLTVTLDKELIPKAKRYARSRGISLSHLVESTLRGIVSGEGTFSQRWRGRFESAGRDDELYRALSAKYS